jgi:hypothetical protein
MGVIGGILDRSTKAFAFTRNQDINASFPAHVEAIEVEPIQSVKARPLIAAEPLSIGLGLFLRIRKAAFGESFLSPRGVLIKRHDDKVRSGRWVLKAGGFQKKLYRDKSHTFTVYGGYTIFKRREDHDFPKIYTTLIENLKLAARFHQCPS